MLTCKLPPTPSPPAEAIKSSQFIHCAQKTSATKKHAACKKRLVILIRKPETLALPSLSSKRALLQRPTAASPEQKRPSSHRNVQQRHRPTRPPQKAQGQGPPNEEACCWLRTTRVGSYPVPQKAKFCQQRAPSAAALSGAEPAILATRFCAIGRPGVFGLILPPRHPEP